MSGRMRWDQAAPWGRTYRPATIAAPIALRDPASPPRNVIARPIELSPMEPIKDPAARPAVVEDEPEVAT